MTCIQKFVALIVLNMSLLPFAVAASAPATAISTSPTVSLFKTVFGLAVVLLVMAAFAWLVKRMTGRQGYSQSVARIVGGVSVGSKERVVVLEVGNRWLVVGVAGGKVNAIANLGQEDGAALSGFTPNTAPHAAGNSQQPQFPPSLLQNGQSFAAWLKQSLNKAYKKHDV